MLNKNSKLMLLILAIIIMNLSLAYIPWIPSFNTYVYLVTFVSYIFITVLGYMLIKSLHLIASKKNSRHNSSGLYIIGVVLFLGVLAINVLMYSNFIKGEYLSINTFPNKTFYLYETGFVDSIVELRVKHDSLPIVSDTLFIINNHGKVSLERVGNIIYLIHTKNKLKEVEKIKIYDLELNKDFSDDYAFLSNDKATNKNVPSIALVSGLIVYSYDKIGIKSGIVLLHFPQQLN
ncbi:hypothetical protein LR004_00990 [Candidatus Gracilibacteria bacterium]|nr:hypothetical protein [Candidatus Gracilibacteria bacterium]